MRILHTMLASLIFTLDSTFGVFAAAQQALIGSNYESFTDIANCQATYYCDVSFPPIPAGKTILITRVTCRAFSNSGPVTVRFGPTTTDRGEAFVKRTYFEEISSRYSSPFFYYTFQAIPMFHIGGGRYPTVHYRLANTSSGIGLECSLSGTAV